MFIVPSERLKRTTRMIVNVRDDRKEIDREVDHDLPFHLFWPHQSAIRSLSSVSKFRRDILMAATVDTLTIVADGIGNAGSPGHM